MDLSTSQKRIDRQCWAESSYGGLGKKNFHVRCTHEDKLFGIEESYDESDVVGPCFRLPHGTEDDC